MSNNYRVHYRKGELDIEVESTDKNYVDSKVAELLASSSRSSYPQKIESAGPPLSRVRKEKPASEGESAKPEIDVAGVVAKIQDSDKTESIEKNILNKAGRLPRILLVFQFAHEHRIDFLTTGDIEDITDQLGTKISQSNVAHCIADNRKYFTAKSVRRRGAKVPYKINRQGELALDKFIAGEKP